MPRPPLGSIQNPIRYVDYFANTSLDESTDPIVAPGLGQGQAGEQEPRVRNTRTVSQRVQDDIEYAERRARRDAAAAQARVNARLTRLEGLRPQTQALSEKLQTAVAAWTEADPAAARDYTDFVHVCLAASSTAVRAVDMVYKQTNPPADVHKALRELAKQLHIDARLQADYYMSEWGAESIQKSLNPEIIHATNNTELDIRRCAQHGEHIYVTKWIMFGSGEDYQAWATFPDYDDDKVYFSASGEPLTPRQLLLKIQANFLVRSTVIAKKTNCRFPKTVWESSYDYYVMKWFIKANEYLKSKITFFNGADISKADKKLFDKVFNQIKSFGDSLNWFVIEAMRVEVADYKKKFKRVLKAKENPSTSVHVVKKMEEHLKNVEQQFLDFEKKYGRVLGEGWRELSDSRGVVENTATANGW